MNCHKMKLRILEGDLTPAEEEHLEDCADCTEYSRTVNRVQDQFAEVEPPKHLDHLVLSYARRQNRTRRVKRIMYLKLAASAAAAVLALLVGIEAFRRWQRPAPPAENRIVEHRQPRKTVAPVAPEQLRQAPERRQPEIVAEFNWDNDPVEAELAEIQAEFLLLTADDEAAAVVSALIE